MQPLRRLKVRAFTLLLCGSLLGLTACFQHATNAPMKSQLPSEKPSVGSWYLIEHGGLVATSIPFSIKVPFLPWTVQSRAAGFVQLGGTLYVALNGWGIIALPDPAAPLAAITSIEEPDLFAGRTINGVYDDSGNVLVHLYHNTMFTAQPPKLGPITAALLEVKLGRIEPIVLPSSRAGWEAVDVVHAADGRWVIAWKRSLSEQVQFKYSAYSPMTRSERPISRAAYLSAYGYAKLSSAPAGLGSIASAVESMSAGDPVVDLHVRTPDVSRILRYRLGSERRLVAGDANLISVPVIATSTEYFALAEGGVILSAPRGSAMPSRSLASTGALSNTTVGRDRLSAAARIDARALPLLPEGYAYTDLWTNGRILVVSWEEQRFTEVGAAGLYVAPLSFTTPIPPPRSSGKP